jgi:hypothetical protein
VSKNRSVFLLVSLKQTLTQLSLAKNPNINNEVVPAILLLSNLSFLSIFDTSIEMIGLHHLAETIIEDNVQWILRFPLSVKHTLIVHVLVLYK